MSSIHLNEMLIISKQDSIRTSLIASGNEVTTSRKQFTRRVAVTAVGLGIGAIAIIACFALFNQSEPFAQNSTPSIISLQVEDAQNIETVPQQQQQPTSKPTRSHKNIDTESAEFESASSNSAAPSYIPTTFDLRTKASAVGCDFSVIDEKLCIGGNWAHAISTTVSNTICLKNVVSAEVPLSSQYLLDCVNLPTKCDSLDSRDEFETILNLTSKQGLPTAQCLPYNGLNFDLAASTCNTQCADGSNVKTSLYAFQDLWDDDYATTILNVKQHLYQTGPVIALLQHSATIARYSGSGPSGLYVNDSSNETNFGFRAYKIVGWDLAPSSTTQPILYWIMQNTFSSNWGLNGYIRVKANYPIIEGYYAYTPN